MALNAAITGQITSQNRTGMRQGNVYVIDTAEAVGASLGRMKGLSIKFESVSSEADSQGRMNTMGYNVTAEWTMMQSTLADLDVAFALAAPTDAEDGAAGFNLFFSDEALSEANALIAWNGTTGGIRVSGAFVQVGPEIQFSGDESGIPCTVTGKIPAARMRSFSTAGLIALG